MSMRIDALPPLGFRAWSGPARLMPIEHAHADVELDRCRDADTLYRVAGDDVRVPAGRVLVLWGATPHRLISFDTAAGDVPRLDWVTLPLDVVLGWSLAPSFVQALLAGRAIIDAKDNGPLDAWLFERWSLDRARADARTSRTTTLEIEARLRRLVFEHGWDSPGPGSRPSPDAGPADDAVEAMARFIADHHTEPIDVASIAAAAGLRPTLAMRRFRATTGTTLIRHLTEQRVAHAQRLLVTTDRSTIDIGFDVGFGSVSRFYEAFRAVTGTTPTHLRRVAVRPGRPSRPAAR